MASLHPAPLRPLHTIDVCSTGNCENKQIRVHHPVATAAERKKHKFSVQPLHTIDVCSTGGSVNLIACIAQARQPRGGGSSRGGSMCPAPLRPLHTIDVCSTGNRPTYRIKPYACITPWRRPQRDKSPVQPLHTIDVCSTGGRLSHDRVHRTSATAAVEGQQPW